jgi:hypothetical protein
MRSRSSFGIRLLASVASTISFVAARLRGDGRLTASAASGILGVGVASAIVLTGPDAGAKAGYDSAYGYDRTWNAAVRLVRVDMGLAITEKDAQNGYLLFDYKSNESGGKTSPGSFEFVRTREAEGFVRVVVQLPQMPQYHERVLLDALVRKLRDEYGEPIATPRKAPAPSDAGSNEASGVLSE